MWLIIRDIDSIVVGTNYTREPAAIIGHTIKEWQGDEPEIESVDPTLSDPVYVDFVQSGADFHDLYDQSGNEIDWLNTNIPFVSGADLATLRTYLERVMVENRLMIKAWRYIARKVGRL